MIHGLRFYRASVKVVPGVRAPIFVHSRLDERRSDFDTIFSCIYEDLSGLVFHEEVPEPFVTVEDDYWVHASEVVHDPRKGCETRKFGLMPANVLAEFGRRVSDDWNSAIFFAPGQLSAEKMRKIGEAVEFEKVFAECEAARLIFHNWDGVYWEIFCKDSRLTEKLAAHHRGDARLRIFKVDFALDYPDPRNGVTLEAA